MNSRTSSTAAPMSHCLSVPSVLLVLSSVFFSGCAESKPAGPPQPPQNLLIVLLDATSARHLHDWGYRRDTTPNLRKLARGGVTFLNAHSQAANTTPSVWSFFTGRYPYVPGEGYTTHRPYPDDITMADAFRAAGFQTGAISESPWIVSKYGWDKGFDYFKDVPALYDPGPNKWSRNGKSTQLVLDFAREWIEQQRGARWFCYVHLLRPHDPYDPPEPFASRYGGPLRLDDHPRAEHIIRNAAQADPASITDADIEYMNDLYDANLRYVDSLVGAFVEWLDSAGLRENTLVVFMSDHGEAFMEHDIFGHNTTVYEEVVNVPLVFLGPKSARLDPGIRHDLVDLVDLMPTFVELFELNSQASYVGTSLVQSLRGEAPSPRATSVSFSAFDHYQVAYRHGDLKLVGTADPAYRAFEVHKLFNIGKDPREQHSIASDVSLLGPLLEAATAHLAAAERRDTSTDPVLTTIDREQLEALGYVSKRP